MNFFSDEKRLVSVGAFHDDLLKSEWHIKREGGNVESFEIAADEQLIGCELYHGPNNSGYGDFFKGVTWLKWKINS